MSRAREIRKTLLYVLVLNWLVAVAKIFFGYSISSNSMLADGFHSLSDGSLFDSNILITFQNWSIPENSKLEFLDWAEIRFTLMISRIIWSILFISDRIKWECELFNNNNYRINRKIYEMSKVRMVNDENLSQTNSFYLVY